MNEKTLRALVQAGAVKRVRAVADGAYFHVEADAGAVTHVALTGRGQPRTWSSLDAVARWLRGLGVGTLQVDVARWSPGQRGLRL